METGRGLERAGGSARARGQPCLLAVRGTPQLGRLTPPCVPKCPLVGAGSTAAWEPGARPRAWGCAQGGCAQAGAPETGLPARSLEGGENEGRAQGSGEALRPSLQLQLWCLPCWGHENSGP